MRAVHFVQQQRYQGYSQTHDYKKGEFYTASLSCAVSYIQTCNIQTKSHIYQLIFHSIPFGSVQFNSVHIVRTTKIIATILSYDILRIRVESSLFSSQIKIHKPRDRSSIYIYTICVNGMLNKKTNVFTKLVLVEPKFRI